MRVFAFIVFCLSSFSLYREGVAWYKALQRKKDLDSMDKAYLSEGYAIVFFAKFIVALASILIVIHYRGTP